MYSKEQLIHEAVKVLKVCYYLVIILSIKVALEIVLIAVPTTTKTDTFDKTTGKGTETITKTYRIF